MAPLLVETVGVVYLVTTLGAPAQGFTTGAMALALTLCAWRRSGAQVKEEDRGLPACLAAWLPACLRASHACSNAMVMGWTGPILSLSLSLAASTQSIPYHTTPHAFPSAFRLLQFNPGVTLAIFLLKRQLFRWASLLFYVLAHLAGALIGSCLLILLPLALGGGGGDYPPVQGVLQEEVLLDGRGAAVLLVLATAFLATFVANTDAEYDEGFLHPALMVGLAFTGLVAAAGGGGGGANTNTALQTGLFNPAVTLVLWAISRAPAGVVLLGTVSFLRCTSLPLCIGLKELALCLCQCPCPSHHPLIHPPTITTTTARPAGGERVDLRVLLAQEPARQLRGKRRDTRDTVYYRGWRVR